jgi:hypothetical protein
MAFWFTRTTLLRIDRRELLTEAANAIFASLVTRAY